MGGRYVPPARRSQGQSKDTSSTKEPTINLPRSLEELSLSQPQQKSGGPGSRRRLDWDERPRQDGEFDSAEIHDYYWPGQLAAGFSEEGPTDSHRPTQSTLNDSHKHKGELTYIRLFPDANPRWDSDNIIFAHTSINILPGYTEAFANAEDVAAADVDLTTQPQGKQSASEFIQSTSTSESKTSPPPTTTTPPISHPIAVFTQTYPERGSNSSVYFRFTGWYQLRTVDFLHPNSPDLTRMMQQKWDIKDRRGKDVRREKSAWAKSMALRWAVCKFEKLEVQDEAPAIQVMQEEDELEDGDQENLLK